MDTVGLHIIALAVLLLCLAACCIWRRELQHLSRSMLFARFRSQGRSWITHRIRRRQRPHAGSTTSTETSILVLHSSFAGPSNTPSGSSVRTYTQGAGTLPWFATCTRPPTAGNSALGEHPRSHVGIQETASSKFAGTQCVTGQQPWPLQSRAAGALPGAVPDVRAEWAVLPVQETSCGYEGPSDMVTITAHTTSCSLPRPANSNNACI